MSILLFSPEFIHPSKKVLITVTLPHTVTDNWSYFSRFFGEFHKLNCCCTCNQKVQKWSQTVTKKNVCVCVCVCGTDKFLFATRKNSKLALSTHHNFSVDLSGTPVICWFVSPFPFFLFLFSCCGNNYLPWLTINGAPTIVSCLPANQRRRRRRSTLFFFVSEWLENSSGGGNGKTEEQEEPTAATSISPIMTCLLI